MVKNSIKIIIGLAFTSLFCACAHKEVTPCADLLAIEQLVESHTDSASTLLRQFKTENADRFNRAFYNLLYVQVASKAGQDVYMLDTLLNYSLEEFARVKDKKYLAQALILQGESWEELSEPKQATDCYLQALHVLEGSRNYTQKLHAYSSLGYIYKYQGLFDEAFDAFKSCYESTLPDTCERNKFISLRNMGYIHFHYENFDSSFYYFRQAMRYAEKSKDSIELKNVIYNDLANYYDIEKKEYEKALSYINKISVMTNKSYMMKGSIFFSLQQYDSASYYMQQAIYTGDLYTKITGYYELSELEEELGNYKNALFYMDKYVDAKDSLSKTIHTSEIHAINHKHNIRKAIHKIENKHKLRIIILINLFIIALLLVTATAVLKSRKRKMQQVQQMAHKEKEISDMQTQMMSTRNAILQLKYEHEQTTGLQQQIEEKENRLEKQQKQLNQLRIHQLEKSPVYKKIKELSIREGQESVTVLPSKEREELKNVVHKIHADLFRELNTLSPSLSEEDILFCCLAQLGFSLSLIAACTGYTRLESARQKRYRIGKKMAEETQSEELYHSFFKQKPLFLINCSTVVL